MTAREVTLLYFASAKSALGNLSSESFPLPRTPFPLRDLEGLVADRHPEHAAGWREVVNRSAWSVDEMLISNDEAVELQGGETVAVIPPVSGG